ncbi:hypothetical protein SeLEV6574_g01872 [Synchytrium endobioticum]|uniref:Uncharacterized protein n=1 Tax=Synchytrium endobioticum TaxID=286115 RepID=A0A507DB17_9FUNG|nr:hypothetical protein SeLEV6574_g01872 [Synchytrium endobioticum]
MVTDQAPINKIVSTLASTPHKESIEASLLTAAKTLVQAWEILSRFENLTGSDALFGTMAKKALPEQSLSRTTTSFHAKVGEPSVTSLKRNTSRTMQEEETLISKGVNTARTAVTSGTTTYLMSAQESNWYAESVPTWAIMPRPSAKSKIGAKHPRSNRHPVAKTSTK